MIVSTSRFLTVLLLLFISFTASAQASETELSEELKGYFKKSILSKVKRLEHYITLIANKTMDDNLRKSSIDQAVELFEDENKIVQISNLKMAKKQFRKGLYGYISIDSMQLKPTGLTLPFIR